MAKGQQKTVTYTGISSKPEGGGKTVYQRHHL
jgi:hypothetical protein